MDGIHWSARSAQEVGQRYPVQPCQSVKEQGMKIKVEVSEQELAEMCCDSVEEFSEQLRHQLDDAISDDEGGAGDWMVEYNLEVIIKN